MPAARYFIASTTVGAGGASSIDFSSIPSTYTDLVIKASLRSDRSTGSATYLTITFNNDTGSNYALCQLDATGSGTSSYRTSSATPSATAGGAFTQATNTASTFGSTEIYIPNYTSSNQKSIGVESTQENNATTSYMDLAAQLWTGTSAINRITLGCTSSANFVQYSTAVLYGIKNS